MNSSYRQYTSGQVSKMNYGYPWNGTLSQPVSEKNKSGLYELHATGDADLNGRKYIALPSGTKLTADVKKQYNIM